eukprot:3948323-Pleurochrysis_carterae.AAC.1
MAVSEEGSCCSSPDASPSAMTRVTSFTSARLVRKAVDGGQKGLPVRKAAAAEKAGRAFLQFGASGTGRGGAGRIEL